MYGPGLVRHGDRVFPQRSVLCVFDIWKSPRPIYIAFLWCLWTDAILRLKQGTKSGEFRKTGKQPGSDLSYGHNTDFHKIKPVFNSAKRQSWVWVWAWRAIYIGVSTAKPCDVTPASLKPTTLGGGKKLWEARPLRKWILAVSTHLLSLGIATGSQGLGNLHEKLRRREDTR